jgi:hypothetical protein
MSNNIKRSSKKSETKRGNRIFRKPKKRLSQTKTKNLPVDQVLHLQRTIGNRAVARLIRSGIIQAKLKIDRVSRLTLNQPNDIYEKEADSVADRVMSMPEEALAPAPASSPNPKRQEETLPNHWMQKQPDEEEELKAKPLAEQITPLIQRQAGPEEEKEAQTSLQRQAKEEEEKEPAQTKLLQRQEGEKEEESAQTKLLQRQESEKEEEAQTKLQRQAEEKEEEKNVQTKLQRQAEEPEEEEKPAQTKATPNNTPKVTPNIESSINAMKGGGQPLSESTRSFFEPRFDADFSKVRLHTDSKAAETAKSINAKAFTTGKNIIFNSGQYSPGTSSGKHLLAHELTHVIQQNPMPPTKQPVQQKQPKDKYEQKANQVTDSVMKTPGQEVQGKVGSGKKEGLLQMKSGTLQRKQMTVDKEYSLYYNNPSRLGKILVRRFFADCHGIKIAAKWTPKDAMSPISKVNRKNGTKDVILRFGDVIGSRWTWVLVYIRFVSPPANYGFLSQLLKTNTGTVEVKWMGRSKIKPPLWPRRPKLRTGRIQVINLSKGALKMTYTWKTGPLRITPK